jgi:hypothetical protein
MKGEVRVDSEKGVGTGFTVCLGTEEIAKLENLEERVINIDESRNMQRKGVLIIDDELLAREVLKKYFERMNIEVLGIAGNGEEGF